MSKQEAIDKLSQMSSDLNGIEGLFPPSEPESRETVIATRVGVEAVRALVDGLPDTAGE